METRAETTKRVGTVAQRLLRLLMRVMFRPVFGWRGPDAGDVGHFEVGGIDGSSLNAACHETNHSRPRGVVILCHPFLKYGMNYFFRNGYHRWLAGAGYHAVAFNFKGFGTSTLVGVSFADDVTSIALWARLRYPELPLHLLGVSFGGYHGVHSLAAQKPVVSSVLLDSVPASISSFFDSGLVGAAMRWLSGSRWAAITGTKALIDSLSAMPAIPCLFLYGNQDRYISGKEIEKIGMACNSGKTVMYEDCGHLEIRKRHPEDYVQEVVRFFDEHSVHANAITAGCS